MNEHRVQRKLTAILSSDVVGYSRLMGADETGTLAQLKLHREKVFDPLVSHHGGRVVKLMGDGALIEFPSAVEAVACGIAIQRGIADQNGGSEKPIDYRIGINLGDVIVDGDDLYGDGVNVADRIQGLAEHGSVALSGAVYAQVIGKLDCRFEDLGHHQVKNIDRPLHIYRVVPGEEIESSTAEISERPKKPSVAILAFDNRSGDTEQEYFADGISEDITISLSKLSQLRVIDRNSSFTYKGRSAKAQEIARELGVNHLVEGSVRKAGNRVRVTAELIDCATGGHLWAERFDRELTDIFEVQDEITREIASALAVALTVDERERLKLGGPKDLEAYDYFLRGRVQYRRLSRESNAQAERLLNRAIDLSPDYSTAYAYLTFTWLADYFNHWRADSERSLGRAEECAWKGVAADENDPYAHLALGKVHMWNRRHDEAIASHDRTVDLDPNFAVAHAGLGLTMHYAGRNDEAIRLIERGMRLDPHYPDIRLHWLAQPHFQLGHYHTTAELLEELLRRKPDTDVSRVLLASSYGHLGRIDEAREEWAKALGQNPSYSLRERRHVLPYKDLTDFDRIEEGLQKAGLLSD